MAPRPRFLVADDDPELLVAVAEALELLGAEVLRADSGAEFIARLARDGPFGLVVTDVAMPWMSGLRALEAARKAGLSAPVLVMTALKDPTLEGQVAAMGTNAHLLRKPFGLGELETAVRSVLAQGAADAQQPG